MDLLNEVPANAVHSFMAPANTTLSASTTYWLVTSNSDATNGQGFRVRTNPNTNLDSGTAAGWSIGNARWKNDIANTSWSTTSSHISFEIRGTSGTTTNNPPTVATVIPDQTATVGTAFSYAFPDTTFTDADTGDTLTYTATKADDTALPSWLVFTAGTRTFSGTPQAAGTVAVKVTASDGNGGSVSDTFDITVAADTTPPTLTSATVFGSGVFIQLQFSENMLQSSWPSTTTFTVTAAGSAVTVYTVQPATGLLNAFWIRVRPTIHQGQAVVVTYTGNNAANALQDIAGNDVATFTTGLNGVPAVTNSSTVTNTPATGAPTITGTAQVGQTLTATVGDIADVDGLPDPFLTDANTSFQWIRVATDNSETDISGAMAGAYTLVADDQGTTIKVKVSFTGNNGFAETRTSAVTAAVSADTTPPTLISATVVPNGSIMLFQFSENLDGSNRPPVSAFTVTAGGNTITNSSTSQVPGSRDGVALSFSPPYIRQGQTVVLTYTDPTGGNDANAIQDTAGNDAETFTTDLNSVPAVINNSTLAPVAPGAPTGLTATASGSTQIDLSWTAPADNGGRVITGYKIEISPNGTDTWTTHLADTTNTNTTYAHTGLAASTTRHYRVSAINTIGTSAASNVDDATTGAGTNTPATGAPTITGTAQVGQTLTAVTTAIMDADGLTNVSYTYQWIRVATDNTETNIASATASTYTLVTADLGTTIKVKVSFTDDASNAETLTSAATAAVAAAPDTTPPTLTSADVEGDALIIELEFSENLQLSNRPAVSAFTVTVDGSAATVSSVLVPGSLLPQDAIWLQLSTAILQGQAVVVTYTDPTAGDDANAIQDTAGNDAADFTTGMDSVPAVTNNSTVTNTPATGAPTITGTAQVGQTLTAATTAIMDAEGLTSVSYTYQWIRTAAGVATDISGATASTYTLVAADLGTTVKVKVSFTDDASNAETLTSTATAAVAAAANTLPLASNGTVTTNEDTAHTFAASEFSFSDADPGDTLESVEIITLPASGTGTLALSGTPVTAGQEIAEADIGTLTYTPPANANGTGYASFTFKVSDGTAESAAAYTMTITVTAVNDAPTVANTIPDRSATAGTAFSYAFPANTFSDADTGDTLTYAATKADGATLPTWLSFAAGTRTFSGTPQTADVGTVSVKVTASDGNGGSGSDDFDIMVSAASNTPATGAPTITGTAQVGQTLTAGTTAIMDADGLTNVSYTYQWIRVDGGAETNISGATASTHTLVTADQGKTIKVKVSFTDDLNNPETLTSAATAAVSAAPNTLPLASDGTVTTNEDSAHTFAAAEFNFSDADPGDTLESVEIITLPASGTGTLALSGTPAAGETLTADVSGIDDVDGLSGVTYSYQWIRVVNGSDIGIPGENLSTYTLQSEDTGNKVKVRVSFTDGQGGDEMLTSDEYPSSGTINEEETSSVVVPDPPPFSPPTEEEVGNPPTEEVVENPPTEEVEEGCAVSDVTGDDRSLEIFVECAAQRIEDSDTFTETLRILEGFRDDEGNWNDGSTYLVLLTARGGVYFHANDRDVEDLDWSGILSCEGEGSVLDTQEGCFIEYEDERRGYAHPLSASHVPLARDEAEFVLLGGFNKIPEEGKPFTGMIGEPSTEAGEVDTDDRLRKFVGDAGRVLGEAVSDPGIDPAELRGILRREEGPWREGDVYIYILGETGRVIFDGADRDREQKNESAKRYVRDLISGADANVVEYREDGFLIRGYTARVEVLDAVYFVGSGYRVEGQPGGSDSGGGGCAVGGSDKGGAFGLFLAALALLLAVSLKRRLAPEPFWGNSH